MKLIHCHMCKLDKGSCNEECLKVKDIATILREDAALDKPYPNRLCTAAQCSHNPTGLKCEIDICRFGRVRI